MGIRQDLQYSIHRILNSNRDGSFATQHDRKNILYKFANDLVSLGYGLRDISGLKEKHVTAVIQAWQKTGLANSTLKNRTTALRHLCAKINKPNIVQSNQKMNIPNRVYVPSKNRALYNPNFSGITNEYVRTSLELQRVFGLRREESLKIRPWVADRETSLRLEDSWCKGGRGRSIPIRTEEQRYWLNRAKELVQYKDYSLIPKDKSYIQHRYVYEKQTARCGLSNLHGLRHAYAQARYKELTSWDAPLNGGPISRALTDEQKNIDHQARMVLTEELGHSREQITVNYLGR
jgi:site-specific recombinase XerC